MNAQLAFITVVTFARILLVDLNVFAQKDFEQLEQEDVKILMSVYVVGGALMARVVTHLVVLFVIVMLATNAALMARVVKIYVVVCVSRKSTMEYARDRQR